ncbi:MAG: hypothetical protein JRN56_07425 [Nitrososphaerota archaeon]|nr:hypothetical protein [Nitrososphaerota archaeon]MDG6937202.1 hypothetical protein [Nitrososphaerota archaeon]MDG6961783.1 hypothetical protein [Nitrososphaerota archaeon]MDG6970315.1 hypothetical protein [Nitrososphaerota archaeon]MDG6972444.1 hypothetical protein [Nitrososphaerota archaeon]
MRAGTLTQRGGPIARSLRITGSTHLMVATFSAAVALNGAAAAQALGVAGLVVAVAVVFASLAVCSAAISIDILRRSGKTVSDLRSIGATSSSISSAIFGSVLAYGALGSAVGAVVGAALGSVLAGPGLALSTVYGVVAVVVASSAALAIGTYTGGRATWRS